MVIAGPSSRLNSVYNKDLLRMHEDHSQELPQMASSNFFGFSRALFSNNTAENILETPKPGNKRKSETATGRTRLEKSILELWKAAAVTLYVPGSDSFPQGFLSMSNQNLQLKMDRAVLNLSKDDKGQGEALSSGKIPRCNETLAIRVDTDAAIEQLEIPYRKAEGLENSYLFGVNNTEQIEEIVAKLEGVSKVAWTIKQTRKFEPCVKKNPRKPLTIWKRLYGCRMATRTRTKTKKLRNKKSRNINCPAKLLVSIRTFVSASRKKTTLTLFDKQFPCLFQFRNHHNHLVDVPETLTTKLMENDLKEAICRLLNKGHSCASAFQTLYVLKAEEFGPNYQTKITDRHNFARRNDISSIFKTHGFKEKYHRYLQLSYTIKNLNEMMNSYEENNGTIFKISSKDDSISICLSTPLMQRNVQQMSEVLYIEPSNDEFKEFRIYFILTETSVGALPISCILTNKRGMPAFSQGMKLFFEMMQIQPTIVFSNATIIAELVRQKYFPTSKKLLTFYHAVSAAWRVLHETRHELPRIKKESYYHLFREIVFASSEEGLMIARQVLAVECTHPKFLSFIDKMYESISLWCMYYRQFMSLNGVSSFDYNKTEISFMRFRLISKIALERTKLFNINQITDFICSAFEKFYKNRILEMVFGKTSPVLEEKYGRIGEIDLPQMEDIGHHLFLFTKSIPELSDEYYQVDMLTDLCTCGIGSIGKHCDHVAETLSKRKVFSPELTLDEKAAFCRIATGKFINRNEFSNARNLSLLEERAFCSSPVTVVGSTESDLLNGNWSYGTTQEQEITRKKWMLYANKISQLIEKNPAKFVPAINTHLNNIEKYSTTLPMLLEGLYSGFPSQNESISKTEEPPPLTIINAKNNSAAGKVKKVFHTLASLDSKAPPSVKKNSEKIKIHQQVFLSQAKIRLKNNNYQRDGAIVTHQVPVEPNLKLIWENNIENPKTEETHYNKSLQCHSPVLKGNADFVEEQLQDGEEEIDESMILEQFSNPDFELNPEPIRNPTRNESSRAFDVENTVYVDESALRQLARNDVTITDENQEVLMLPLETDYSLKYYL